VLAKKQKINVCGLIVFYFFILFLQPVFASEPELIDQEKINTSEKNIELRIEKMLSFLS